MSNFIDEAHINVRAGRGGDGMVAWRREKYIPRGGPAGGDGGRGGDVIFVASEDSHTLMELRYLRHVRAEHGQHGGPKKMTGRSGKDEILEVPLGTLVYDDESGELLADLTEHGQRYVAAKGGDGGLGNQHFATSRNRAPRKATQGFPGGECMIRLELKLLADVGLVGFPSVGKSTLIGALSNARPQVAAYPFTTLTPHLGVVRFKSAKEFVIADIPGIIEGAHEGHGLGLRFLRHVERTRILVHVLEVTEQLEGMEDGRDPIADYEKICHELEQFDPELLERPKLVVLNKCDLDRVREREQEVRAYFEERGIGFLMISAAGRIGLEPLIERLGVMLYGERAGKEWWED